MRVITTAFILLQGADLVDSFGKLNVYDLDVAAAVTLCARENQLTAPSPSITVALETDRRVSEHVACSESTHAGSIMSVGSITRCVTPRPAVRLIFVQCVGFFGKIACESG